MPKEFSRPRRVAELVQRELAILLTSQVHDPRIGFVTVTGVELSKDLKHAKVFVTRLDQQHSVADEQQLMTALSHASGYLRRELSRGLKLRVSPTLRFFYDTSIERGNQLSKLIEDAMHSVDETESKG